MHVLFSVDIIISFRVAYTDKEALITDSAAVARNYCRCNAVLLIQPAHVMLPALTVMLDAARLYQ
jgi:hypothetical protein